MEKKGHHGKDEVELQNLSSHEGKEPDLVTFTVPPALQRRKSEPVLGQALSSIYGPSEEIIYSRKLPILLGTEDKYTVGHQGKHEDEHSHLLGEESVYGFSGQAKRLARVLFTYFMGGAPRWYKLGVLGALLINPLIMVIGSKFVLGWVLTAEFIATLALSLYSYPLQPGGILVFEAVLMGMSDTHRIEIHVEENLPVILLLMFMVAAIHFMKQLLRNIFMRIFIIIPDKRKLCQVIFLSTAILGAFLDSLTVTAVIIVVCTGFYAIYHKVASEESKRILAAKKSGKALKDYVAKGDHDDSVGFEKHRMNDDSKLSDEHKETLVVFRRFLRSMLMHVCVATAAGGIATPVGEPQNLLIGQKVGWNFLEYCTRCFPVTVFTLWMALITCFILETNTIPIGKVFDYGGKMPPIVLQTLKKVADKEQENQTPSAKMHQIVQMICGLFLVICLSTHVAEVGLIGLTVMVLITVFNGIVKEHELGDAFTESLPFTGLLVVFFCVAAIIEEQELFRAMVNEVLALDGRSQITALYLIDGVLSMVSDNVFVATVYINEVYHAWELRKVTDSDLNLLAVAINISTNIPSLATPNGQAAFLFLYTSALAPIVGLSYLKMVWMALPYFFTLSTVSLIVTIYLREFTESMVAAGWLTHV